MRLDEVVADLDAYHVHGPLDMDPEVSPSPPQLAMVEWFRRRGLPADFLPGRPERSA